jgi:hypothetical protein
MQYNHIEKHVEWILGRGEAEEAAAWAEVEEALRKESRWVKLELGGHQELPIVIRCLRLRLTVLM